MKPKKRQMEYLTRGLIAVKTEQGVFVSWRFLGTDHETVTFHIYRNGDRITDEPIADSTNFLDGKGTEDALYQVAAVYKGRKERLSKEAPVWRENVLELPLNKPEGGVTPDGKPYTYSANDASVGDVDGDGEYEIILKWNPSNSKDNAHDGYTGDVLIDAYKLNGAFLWRINLGRNIRAGAHYTQFMVYDLDGDGKAEIAMKTADGTIDGKGNIIGEAHADFRDEQGRILSGPEYLTVFKGETGEALTTVDYEPPRGKLEDWGDGYGNRMDRFLAGIAYLDGERPSLVMARGYYTRTVLVAYDFRNGRLKKRWTFDSNQPGHEAYAGQGNHSLSVADVDGDGKDEIIYGAMAVDHDGTGLYTTELGHGDAMHVGDLDPSRKGLEVFQVHEDASKPYGLSLRDAGTGEVLWGVHAGTDVGRGMAAHIDPRYKGALVWGIDPPGNEGMSYGLYTSKGEKISDKAPASANFSIWWDGDLVRELLDHDWNGTIGKPKIEKWDAENRCLKTIFQPEGVLSNNGTKGNPVLQANLFGDWREEVIWRTEDSSALLIYTTTHLTRHRFYTLMHDPVYRLGIAWQNTAYNQPPHTSFYLGTGMKKPPKSALYIAGNKAETPL
ncbi:rhamnogalacturonan lyase [Bacillus halotolerans]|uniref:rhamnogalacturonan lyase n=1 Tax=Bacillus halotolerans TaxID=260554 RepID=UPI000D01F738|nr:rhamnogalacturonan lyase [Bacillus halotolerans]PRP50437.1 rhamnogalacturonan lyase [Bacillus halotolerans]PRP58843.1 rhamnogalacturonan lyase [Bacillus halotolerans]PRP62709.1 rhamnogalacturonan lyase [Bacillus halotolerans]